ncbi:MAG: hypothetical protein E6G11_05455 [Actinobacteria bacterium]|nr:MAG: hypothetical protein E6G11_05455 [Actinomycetota bacterium]
MLRYENRASGPELPDEQKQENERPETCERARDLPDTLGMRKTEPFSNEDSEGSDREETRRRVVAAGGVREAAVVSKPVRVVQRLSSVVARDRRVYDGVAHGHDGEDCEQRDGDGRVAPAVRTRYHDLAHAQT